MSETESYDTERQVIHSHREWRGDDGRSEYDYWLHVYSKPQWERMLFGAGFDITDAWGAYDGRPPGRSYNQNLWIDHPFEGAAYLPR